MADDDRSEKATSKRRGELKQKGDLPRSRDVNTAVLLALVLMTLSWFGGVMFDRIGEIAAYCFGNAGEFVATTPEVHGLIIRVSLAFTEAMLPIFTAAIGAAIIANAIQGSITFVTKPLEPKWGRLNPISGFMNLFKIKDRVIDLTKSFALFLILSLICYLTVREDADKLPGLLEVPIQTYFLFEMELAYRVIKNVLILYIVIAAIDYAIQHYRFEERNKMTKQEVKDEHRQMEGDPKVKARIRRLQIEATRRRMMEMVPKADVVITNPTHYAVALMYDPDKMVAPQVVAKGMNLIAKRIIALAEENNVTIYRDPPLARTLFRDTEPGDAIPQDLFKAVAEILAHVYKVTKKAGVTLKPLGAR